MKKVSIISVDYNQHLATLELLASLEKCNYQQLEVIVVDNGSKVPLAPQVEAVYPWCRVVRSEQNLGFAEGNNLGIKFATGDYLFFVNNDTLVTPGLVEALARRLSGDKEIGMVSPKIRYAHHPNVIQYAGFTAIHPLTGRSHSLGWKELDQSQYDQARPTEAAHGAAMMVRRSVLTEVGPMPDVYFLYYEERDWCERVKEAGYSIWYEPSGLIYHQESLSTGKESPLKTYFMTRNRLLFMRRNVSTWRFILFCAYFYCLVVPRTLIKQSIKGKVQLLKAFFQGINWTSERHFKQWIPNG